MTQKQIARYFSIGQFNTVSDYLAGNIVWHIYEEKLYLQGKDAVVKFSSNIAQYFQSVTTQFETTAIIEEENKVAVYGQAVFSRGGKMVNTVNSCDIYSFDETGKIAIIHSYCNSNRPGE